MGRPEYDARLPRSYNRRQHKTPMLNPQLSSFDAFFHPHFTLLRQIHFLIRSGRAAWFREAYDHDLRGPGAFKLPGLLVEHLQARPFLYDPMLMSIFIISSHSYGNKCQKKGITRLIPWSQSGAHHIVHSAHGEALCLPTPISYAGSCIIHIVLSQSFLTFYSPDRLVLQRRLNTCSFRTPQAPAPAA